MNLGKSLQARYREHLGLPFELPADGYHGEDVRELSLIHIYLCAHSEGRWVDPEELTQYAFQPADAPIIQNVLEVVPCLSEPKK